jgi:hypothetical protein
MKKTKKQNPIPKGTRFPRPLGITLKAMEGYGTRISHILNPLPHPKQKNNIKPIVTEEQYNKTKQRIKYDIIEHWTQQGMSLNKQSYTLNQLSIYLNMEIELIMKYSNIAMKKISKWIGDEQGMQDKARVLFFQSLKMGLENISLNRAQVDLLMASQGAEYKPFISSTVNQALANHTGALAPLLNLIKVLENKPSGGNTIFNTQINNLTKNTQYITTDEALSLIRKNAESMADNPSLADTEIAKLGLESSLPDVNARTQDLTAIGIRHNGTQLADQGTQRNRSKKERDKDQVGHDNRNPHIIDIDEDELIA